MDEGSGSRLAPPFWRHDAYTLRRLAAAVRNVVARVSPGAGGMVIDLGAGAAPYGELFRARGSTYVCCDLALDSEVVIEPGRPVPLPSASAQVVVSFQVLEHVWELDWYLGEARRLLAPGGRLILSTHGVWPYHPHPADFRRWTRAGLTRELMERGFEVEHCEGVVGPLAWTTQFRALGYHQVFSKLGAPGRLLAALAGALFHMRMALEDAVTPSIWIMENAAVYVVQARPRTPGEGS